MAKKKLPRPIKRTLAHRLKQVEESIDGLLLRLQNREQELAEHIDFTGKKAFSLGERISKTENAIANVIERLNLADKAVKDFGTQAWRDERPLLTSLPISFSPHVREQMQKRLNEAAKSLGELSNIISGR